MLRPGNLEPVEISPTIDSLEPQLNRSAHLKAQPTNSLPPPRTSNSRSVLKDTTLNATFNAPRHQPDPLETREPLIPLSEFTIFSKMSIELRLMIWEKTLPEAQFVKIRPGSLYDGHDKLVFHTDATPPGMFRACEEFREAILKVLNVCLESNGTNRKIRLNGVQDTVVICQP
jgi:hypothetical protein